MKTLQRLAGLALGLVLSTTALLAQTTIEVDPPYNPDANEDGIVGSADLMGLLGVFGFDFTPESIFVDGMTLEEYLLELTAWMTELEGQITSSTTNSFGVTDVIINPDNTLQFTFSDGTTLDTPLLVGPEGEPGLPEGPDLVPGTIMMWNGSEWETVLLLGCTNDAADNFNPDAVIDDGTCDYCGGMSTVTFDGDNYGLVTIGSQCWFAENLRTQHYANGDPIPENLLGEEWVSATYGAQAFYDEDLANLDTFGRLYNWYAVDDARGLCPGGWHVPTDTEFKALEMHLGMTLSQVNSTGWRGWDEGIQMKDGEYGSPNWVGNNRSGFSAIPGGVRDDSSASFSLGGIYAFFWSSSIDDSFAWRRLLHLNSGTVNRDAVDKRNGYSVRCLRD